VAGAGPDWDRRQSPFTVGGVEPLTALRRIAFLLERRL
jgi:hypothetical protein